MSVFRVLADFEVKADSAEAAYEVVNSLVKAEDDSFLELELLSAQEVVRE